MRRTLRIVFRLAAGASLGLFVMSTVLWPLGCARHVEAWAHPPVVEVGGHAYWAGIRVKWYAGQFQVLLDGYRAPASRRAEWETQFTGMPRKRPEAHCGAELSEPRWPAGPQTVGTITSSDYLKPSFQYARVYAQVWAGWPVLATAALPAVAAYRARRRRKRPGGRAVPRVRVRPARHAGAVPGVRPRHRHVRRGGRLRRATPIAPQVMR